MDNRIAFARSLRKNMTPEEVKLWVRLRAWRSKGYHFRRQAPVDGYVLDFVCKQHKLIVEVDGGQHGEDRGLAHDEKRDAHFRAKGYRIARLWNADVNRDPDAAADTVWAFLQGENPFEQSGGETPPGAARHPPRASRGGGRGGYSTLTAVPAAVTISMLPLEPMVS